MNDHKLQRIEMTSNGHLAEMRMIRKRMGDVEKFYQEYITDLIKTIQETQPLLKTIHQRLIVFRDEVVKNDMIFPRWANDSIEEISETLRDSNFSNQKVQVNMKKLVIPQKKEASDYDVERIVRVCAASGYEITADVARKAWENYSESMAAGWMLLPDEDSYLLSMVLSWTEIEQ